MKTEHEIRERLYQANGVLDEWTAESTKAKQNFEADNYLEYCYGIIREAKAEVRLLHWILGEENVTHS